jgi:hypothetical protein
MPDIQQHRTKARENEAFADWLGLSGYPCADWMVTVVFYSALHHIESLFRYLGIPEVESDRHPKRRDLLKFDRRLYGESQLRRDYFDLQDDSEDARYKCRPFTLEEARRLRDEQLARIRARVEQLTI